MIQYKNIVNYDFVSTHYEAHAKQNQSNWNGQQYYEWMERTNLSNGYIFVKTWITSRNAVYLLTHCALITLKGTVGSGKEHPQHQNRKNQTTTAARLWEIIKFLATLSATSTDKEMIYPAARMTKGLLKCITDSRGILFRWFTFMHFEIDGTYHLYHSLISPDSRKRKVLTKQPWIITEITYNRNNKKSINLTLYSSSSCTDCFCEGRNTQELARRSLPF